MKFVLPILLLFFSSVFSQKKVLKKILVATHVTSVFIELNQVYTIALTTAKTDTILIRAKSEGEYANFSVVSTLELNNSIHITGGVSFAFSNMQDKLSAHKMHAIALEICVPENLKIHVKSDIGNLHAVGFYTSLITDFMWGNCMLNNVSGTIKAHTVNGNIYLKAQEGAVFYQAEEAAVTKEKLPEGKSLFILKTLKGTINIVHAK